MPISKLMYMVNMQIHFILYQLISSILEGGGRNVTELSCRRFRGDTGV